MGVATAPPISLKKTSRDGRHAALFGAASPRSICDRAGFFITPLTVTRRLTISAGSDGVKERYRSETGASSVAVSGTLRTGSVAG